MDGEAGVQAGGEAGEAVARPAVTGRSSYQFYIVSDITTTRDGRLRTAVQAGSHTPSRWGTVSRPPPQPRPLARESRPPLSKHEQLSLEELETGSKQSKI